MLASGTICTGTGMARRTLGISRRLSPFAFAGTRLVDSSRVPCGRRSAAHAASAAPPDLIRRWTTGRCLAESDPDGAEHRPRSPPRATAGSARSVGRRSAFGRAVPAASALARYGPSRRPASSAEQRLASRRLLADPRPSRAAAHDVRRPTVAFVHPRSAAAGRRSVRRKDERRRSAVVTVIGVEEAGSQVDQAAAALLGLAASCPRAAPVSSTRRPAACGDRLGVRLGHAGRPRPRRLPRAPVSARSCRSAIAVDRRA